MISAMIGNHLKNLSGWTTKRKYVAFAVDDYGNVRIASGEARQYLRAHGVALSGRFDRYDALDSVEDFEQLFAVLGSVRDGRGRHPVFTTFAMPCNVDLQRSLEANTLVSEDLDVTYRRVADEEPAAYAGAFAAMHDGITRGFLRPQFHGREHVNAELFDLQLRAAHPHVRANAEVRSMAGIPSHPRLPGVRFTEAYALWERTAVQAHRRILADGMMRFERVYGYRPTVFTPPAMYLHPDLWDDLVSLGIRAIDQPRVHSVHLGEGSYRRMRHVSGRRLRDGLVSVVRNCLFEPNSRPIDWVAHTMAQIQAAFLWRKPAIISSHRVNFCGQIAPENRRDGLQMLHALLRRIVETWPDIEFVSVDELVSKMPGASN